MEFTFFAATRTLLLFFSKFPARAERTFSNFSPTSTPRVISEQNLSLSLSSHHDTIKYEYKLSTS